MNVKNKYVVAGPDNYNDSTPSIFAKSIQNTEYTINITSDIGQPNCYDSVIALLLEAEEGDGVNFIINSVGGRMDSLTAITNAIRMTQAVVTGVLIGDACSAAGALFLNCHQWVVGDMTTLMVHEASFGTGGKGSDVRSHSEFLFKQNDRFLQETYRGFLSDEEIDDVSRGRELYFDDEEIRKRLTEREELRRAALEEAVKEAAQPKRSRK